MALKSLYDPVQVIRVFSGIITRYFQRFQPGVFRNFVPVFSAISAISARSLGSGWGSRQRPGGLDDKETQAWAGLNRRARPVPASAGPRRWRLDANSDPNWQRSRLAHGFRPRFRRAKPGAEAYPQVAISCAPHGLRIYAQGAIRASSARCPCRAGVDAACVLPASGPTGTSSARNSPNAGSRRRLGGMDDKEVIKR